MTAEQLRRVQRAKPFCPYKLLLADGTKIPVPHPEYLLPHPTKGRTIAVAARDGTFHIIDLGADTGIGGREAVKLFIPTAIVSTMVGMISGWLADRIPVRVLVLACVSFQTIAFIGAGRLGDTLFMVMLVVGWGCASGLFSTLLNVAIPNFFGRTHLGAISSVQMSCMVAASAIGPAFLAAAKTYLGSYRVGLLWCCALAGAVFLFALVTPSTPRRTA